MLDDGIGASKIAENMVMSAAGSSLVGFGGKKAAKSSRVGGGVKRNNLMN